MRVWNKLLRWGVVPPHPSDRCLRLHYWAKVACTWLSNIYEEGFTCENFGFIQWVDKVHWTTWGNGEADISSARPSWQTKVFVFHFFADTTPQFLKTLSVYLFRPVKGQHKRIGASKFLWQLLGKEWGKGQWVANCVCFNTMCKIGQERRIGGMNKLPLRNSQLWLHGFEFQVKQGSHWQGWAVPSGRSNAGQVSSFIFIFFIFIFFRAKSAGIQRKVVDSIPGHNKFITCRSSRIWSENDWRGRLCLCPASPFALQWKHFIIFSFIKILYDVKSNNTNNASVLLYYFWSEYLNFTLFLTKDSQIIEKKNLFFYKPGKVILI